MPLSSIVRRVRNFFSPKQQPEEGRKNVPQADIYLRSAVESITGNASLTANLDDNVANELLNWSISNVQLFFKEGLNSIGPIDTQIDNQMQAIRKMMRAVNSWVPTRMEKDIEANLASLEKIAERMTAIHGPNYKPPSRTALLDFLENHLSRPEEELLHQLRTLLEGNKSGHLDEN